MGVQRGYKPKLPAQQLAILAVARFADPVGLTSVNPYLPEMIESFGVNKNDIAGWAGLIGAIFAATQSLTALPWGWASDRIGRKPTLLMGLLLTLVTFVLWGVSSSLPMAIAIRAVQGAGNGNVGIIRTAVAEMVTEKELQPRAFALMPLVWSIGSIFGPAFGGFFSRPADQWPDLFKKMPVFKKFPYLLPNLIAALVFLVCFFVTALYLRETLASKQHKRDWGLRMGEKLNNLFRKQKRSQHGPSRSDVEASVNLLGGRRDDEEAGLDEESSSSSSTVKPGTSSLFTGQTTLILVAYSLLALHATAYDALLPVFLNYPLHDGAAEKTKLPLMFSGGFELTSDRIGTVFTVLGVVSGLIQFLVFPPVCSRFGASRCLLGTAWLFPLAYVATPYLALIDTSLERYVALGGVVFVKATAHIFGFPCITILLTNSAPSLQVLGTLNGLATMTSGIGKAIGPAAVGAAFTFGVHRNYIIVPFWLLAVISVVGYIPIWFIVEGDGPHGSSQWEDVSEETEVFVKHERDQEAAMSSRRGKPGKLSDNTGDAVDLLRVPKETFAIDSDAESDCPSEIGSAATAVKEPAIKLRLMSLSSEPESSTWERGTEMGTRHLMDE